MTGMKLGSETLYKQEKVASSACFVYVKYNFHYQIKFILKLITALTFIGHGLYHAGGQEPLMNLSG